MRSHMMSLPLPPKPSYETESLPESSSSSDSEEDIEGEEDDDDVGMIEEGVLHKLRENPRKSIKLADLEDRESETESTRNPTRRRSKRRRKPPPLTTTTTTTPLFNDKDFADVSEAAEPVSSISEVTSEEDVAFCLMMLSRDKWASCHGRADYGDIIIRDDVTDSYNTTTITITKCNNDGIYRCETCNKVFRSYQALGGHRASHKKIQPVAANAEPDTLNNNNDNNNNERQPKKTHECPVCLRVFASGQALGGHKRSHANDNHQLSDQSPKKIKISENTTLIDLNLPAPLDDDDDDHFEISQFTVSAVSDAHL